MRLFSKRSALFSTIIIVGALLAGCGAATSTTPAATDTPVPTNTVAPTATTASDNSYDIQTATVTVAGASETVLTDSKGFTLYYFTPDTATTIACTGGCASTWPPLLVNSTGTPMAATTLPGKLTAVAGPNGNQIEYNGHPLYTYAGDTAAGQTTGQGVNGKWFVVTPDIAPIS
jgi:predicted lipoprotein with Yx(FWY)xxD motif